MYILHTLFCTFPYDADKENLLIKYSFALMTLMFDIVRRN